MIADFLSNLFDHFSQSSSPSESASPSDSGLTSTTSDSSPSSFACDAGDAWGVAACPMQCAAESSSAVPTFEATSTTWGSIGNTNFGNDF